jgi:choline dehydrogenase-like flavoprotein
LPESDGAYDFIVVGAGSAGCVIANRLSADPAVRVALIEAGPSDRRFPVNWKTTLPIGNVLLLPHARYNWQHTFTGGAGVLDRVIACPRGKLFGGCSSVNGTVYIRGHRSDYNGWAEHGNPGWSYADVLPDFRRHENRREHGNTGYHGTEGELDVQRPASFNPLSEAFVEAAIQAGHARNDDFNGPVQDGFGRYELNQRDGARLSNSRAFLHPALLRPNLHVFADTLVERVLLQGARAVGVQAVHRGERRALHAACEVVLAGGAINSPQLLMLSGIGPEASLRRHGVEVRHVLPGVGHNLQDHPTVFVSCTNPSGESYAWSWRSSPRIALAPLRYALRRTGMLASNAAEAGGFLRSRPGLERPDVQTTFLVGLKGTARTIPRAHGFLLLVQLLRPAARGHLELASADPRDRPAMHPRFLEHPDDVRTLMRGLREARRILGMPALARYRGAEIEPGAEIQDDTELEQAVRRQVTTAYHPVGTCRMGPASDACAVVDAHLCVHGIDGLRVADGSVMPDIIGGNTNAPTTMIGERAAALMLAVGHSGDARGAVHAPAADVHAPVERPVTREHP